MPNLQHKRGSRAALDALATGGGLLAGQIYVITDQNRLAVATSASAYTAFLKEGEGGGGGATNIDGGAAASIAASNIDGGMA